MVYPFKLSSLSKIVVSNFEDLNSVDEWCWQWAMKFSANTRAVLAYKCHVTPGRRFINGLPILITPVAKDLGLQHSF